MQHDNNIIYLLGTSEFRDLEPIEKALKLIKEHYVSQRQAAIACNVDRSAIQRALKAVKADRPIGVPGRPRALNPNEEKQLVQELDEADLKRKSMTFKQFQDKVCAILNRNNAYFTL